MTHGAWWGLLAELPWIPPPHARALGSLSKDVFERHTSTRSEAFSLFICLDANKFVLLSFFSLLKTIYPRVSTKTLPNDTKSPLPVDVRLSTTLLLKLPIVRLHQLCRHQCPSSSIGDEFKCIYSRLCLGRQLAVAFHERKKLSESSKNKNSA